MKKKKPKIRSASGIVKPSKAKVTKETAKALIPEAEKDEFSSTKVVKGNPSKAIRGIGGAIAKEKGIKSKSNTIMRAKTGTPQKALNELIKAGYQKASEKQNKINKEYRKERDRLRRRVAWFEKQGYNYEEEVVPPPLEGNASREEVEYLKALRGEVLKKMATSYTPKETPEPNPEEVEAISDISEESEVYEEETPTSDYISDFDDSGEEEDWDNSPEARAKRAEKYREMGLIPDEEDVTDPQEEYYKNNPERNFEIKGMIERGKLILKNVWKDIEVDQDEFLASRVDEEDDVFSIKQDAKARLFEMLLRAESLLGTDHLAIVIERNATAFKHAVNQVLYFFDSKDAERTQNETSSALTELSSILFSDDPYILMEENFGNPEDV